MTATAQTEIDFDIRPSDHPVPADERERMLAAPAFGVRFTDHMITLRWTRTRAGTTGGWSRTAPSPSIRPRPCSTTRRSSSRA